MARKKLVIEIDAGHPPEPSDHGRHRRWPWVAVGLALVAVLVAASAWFVFRGDPDVPPPPKPVSAGHPAAGPAGVRGRDPATGTVSRPAARQQGGLVGHAGPSSKPVAKLSGPGAIRVSALAPEYAAAFLAGTGKRLRVDTNQWQTVAAFPLTIASLSPGQHRLRLEVEGFACATLLGTNEATVLVDSGATNAVEFALSPLPAVLELSCNATQALVRVSSVEFSVSRPLLLPSLQPLDLAVSAPGYRTQLVRLGPLPPGVPGRREITLDPETGTLRIAATVPEHARDYLAKTTKRMRLGAGDWQEVDSLPHVLTNLFCGPAGVALEADGFELATQRVTVAEGQTAEAVFALTPKPAILTVSCNVTGALARVSGYEFAAFRPFSLDSLHPIELTVSATGYVARTLKLPGMEPGKAYRQEVQLEPVAAVMTPPDTADGEADPPMSVDLGAGVTMELVWIKPGTFMMGSPTNEANREADEGPQHMVTISRGFWMGQKEVTREQWERVMGSNPGFKKSKVPVDYMTWNQWQDFIWELNAHVAASADAERPPGGAARLHGEFRLPTEAEWEYACRAGTTTAFNYGELPDSRRSSFNARFTADDRAGRHGRDPSDPVGPFDPNAWGLYEMHGSVSEWCQDFHGMYRKEPVRDPVGPASGPGRVHRGGDSSSIGRRSRSAARAMLSDSGHPYARIGGRLVFTATNPAAQRLTFTPSEPWRPLSRSGASAPSPERVSQAGKPVSVDLGAGVSMEFVWIEALSVWVGKYEVTNQEYRRYKPKHDSGTFHSGAYSLNGDRQPVVQVDVDDAKTYAERLTQRERAAGRLPDGYRYRLPTDGEWQSFAQCGDGRAYPWGNSWPPQYGNYSGQGDGQYTSKIDGYADGFPVACPVDKSGRNDWGLYGVGGNVCEWSEAGRKRGASWYDWFQRGLRCDESSNNDLSQCGFRLVLGK